jgi:hypothetical protein
MLNWNNAEEEDGEWERTGRLGFYRPLIPWYHSLLDFLEHWACTVLCNNYMSVDYVVLIKFISAVLMMNRASLRDEVLDNTHVRPSIRFI